jgi:hypothetical protein
VGNFPSSCTYAIKMLVYFIVFDLNARGSARFYSRGGLTLPGRLSIGRQVFETRFVEEKKRRRFFHKSFVKISSRGARGGKWEIAAPARGFRFLRENALGKSGKNHLM